MATIEQLKSLQTFPSVAEMDQRISEFVTLNKHNISAAQRKVLDYLRTHAVLVPGVCNASQRKIAAAIGVCKRTVMRAIDFFEKCGLIEVKAQERESGATASHAFVFRSNAPQMSPAMSPADVTPVHEKSFTPFATREKDRNNVFAREDIEISEFVPDHVPKLFAQQVSRIFPSAVKVLELWDVVKAAGRAIKEDVSVMLALKAFNQTDYMRRREPLENFNGYFKRTIVGMWQKAQSDGVGEHKDVIKATPADSNEYEQSFAGLYTRKEETPQIFEMYRELQPKEEPKVYEMVNFEGPVVTDEDTADWAMVSDIMKRKMYDFGARVTYDMHFSAIRFLGVIPTTKIVNLEVDEDAYRRLAPWVKTIEGVYRDVKDWSYGVILHKA